MTITCYKSTVSYKNSIGPSFYFVWTALHAVCFPAKRDKSWTQVILLLGFGLDLGFDCKETTKTHSDFKQVTAELKKYITT
jgi:hypothetical protein